MSSAASSPSRITLLADDGAELRVADHGAVGARTVVLLPGFRAPASSWRFQVPALVDAGFRVLAVDLRGHGDASPNPPGTTMTRRAADVETVLEAYGLEEVDLVGGSMGGNTIWAYLDAHGAGRVRRVVTVDQPPRMLNGPDWAHGYYGYDESNRDTFFAGEVPPTGHGTPLWRRPRRVARMLRAMGRTPGGGSGLGRGDLDVLGDHARADWRPVIARDLVPALFLAGAESELWPSSHAAASAALAAGARAAVVDGAGHATNMEQPRAVNRALLDWLG
ncbi:alpha/beta fold hydrolase [Nocardioides bruguierae]|uniref:Alpha/beta hydrolase n=1 Tax=Nocardioides bruguierae TaxID=2945102 RepID=A0A9X2D8I5_9ACTN|nr:alpha/beta hydrolase [Nocardioides bruguierae]MCM0621019.1 alpha/beta hydrolase [Nocardioides bruguierae]